MSKTIIIFFGPPGSGKGTQADLLAKLTGWKKISTGDLFRAEIAAKTKLGKLSDKYLKAGKLVPDKLVNALFEKALSKDCPGFVLDGYPRNMSQVNYLLALLAKKLKKSDQVYALEVAVSDKEVKERLGQRRMCQCGAVYHLVFNPPINKGLCDLCGGKLFIRNDDKPKVIADRLKIYHKQGEPILKYWQKQGKMIKINGELPIKKIHEEIVKKLKELRLI
jgi:adenylate kinase